MTMEPTTNGSSGLLGLLSSWMGGRKEAGAAPAARDHSHPLTEEEVRDWLAVLLAERLKVTVAEVDTAKTFEEYGLDSRTAVAVSGELEEWLGRPIEPTLLWDCPSIDAVATQLSGAAQSEIG